MSRVSRRLRYGKPIIVVSGLPRSGTSMAMKMLQAGGVPLLADGVRAADESNPLGYYEFEPVKNLDKNGDLSWLRDARARAVKIVSFLLTFLPESYEYRVVFMERDLGEVLASQNTMLARLDGDAELTRRGREAEAGTDESLLTTYRQHLEQVRRFMAARSCFRTLYLDYADTVRDPRDAADRLNAFLGGRLDTARMAAVADPALHRNRAQDSTRAQDSRLRTQGRTFVPEP